MKALGQVFASAGAALLITSLQVPARAQRSAVSVNNHQVRYASGGTVYVEELVKDRLVGRYWGAGGRTGPVNQDWRGEAFEIKIKSQPGPAPGVAVTGGWQWVSASEASAMRPGTRHFVLELSNSTAPLRVKAHTQLDGTPVLTRWLEITNTGGKPAALTALSPWAGRLWSRDAPVNLGASIKWEVRWEGWFGWKPLAPGNNVVEQNRGLTWDDPYFILQNTSNGEYFFGELAWPANWMMAFQKENGVSFKIGPTATNALRVIAPGETIQTPAVHLGHTNGDFDAAVQAMHDHIRKSVEPTRPPDRAYRTQYLIPEDWPMTVYRGERFNEANLKKCMDVAAAVGLEAFIVDGPMWGSAYGNWLVPDQKRFPNGLAPLRDYAHGKNMLFGLYVEPEGGREGFTSREGGATIGPWSESQVFRQHPDWFDQPRSVLKLSIPGAAAYMESEVERLIRHYGLDLYRHDFNAPQRGQGSETRRDGFLESDYWRHYDGFYGAFRRIHEKFPNVILQQASAGGARSDLATAAVFHEQFTSDRATMPFVYRMLSGFSVFLPPEILVNSNGMAYPKDRPDLDTILRGAYALGNTPMIFNAILPRSVEELKPDVRDRFLHYAGIYKSFIRPILGEARVYHHAPVNATGGVESGDWFAMEFGSPDRGRAWAVVIRLSDSAGDSYLLKPRSLDGQKRYRVTFDNTRKAETLQAKDLMGQGIPVRLPKGSGSELLLFEAR